MSILQKKILTATRINFPDKLILADLSTLTYKWDRVPVLEWTDYADKYNIPYKELFSDLNRNGLLYPVIVRDLKNNGVLRKYRCGGRRIIWAKRQGYTHISAYQVEGLNATDEDKSLSNQIVKDQWYRID